MILAYIATLAVIAWLGYSIWYLFRTWQDVKSGKPIISEEAAKLMSYDQGGHH